MYTIVFNRDINDTKRFSPRSERERKKTRLTTTTKFMLLFKFYCFDIFTQYINKCISCYRIDPKAFHIDSGKRKSFLMANTWEKIINLPFLFHCYLLLFLLHQFIVGFLLFVWNIFFIAYLRPLHCISLSAQRSCLCKKYIFYNIFDEDINSIYINSVVTFKLTIWSVLSTAIVPKRQHKHL